MTVRAMVEELNVISRNPSKFKPTKDGEHVSPPEFQSFLKGVIMSANEFVSKYSANEQVALVREIRDDAQAIQDTNPESPNAELANQVRALMAKAEKLEMRPMTDEEKSGEVMKLK